MSDIIWVAYCIDCRGELESAPNGEIIEGIAKMHKRNNLGHKVILGTYITAEDAVLSKR